ncbi:MAG: hypothetical protein WAO93_02740 [Orrella sp.]
MATRKRTIQSNPLDQLNKVLKKTFENKRDVTPPTKLRPRKPKADLPSSVPVEIDRLTKKLPTDLSIARQPKRKDRASPLSQISISTPIETPVNDNLVGQGGSLKPSGSDCGFAELRSQSGERLYVRYVHKGRICRSTLVWSRKKGEGAGFFDEQHCFISMAKMHGPLNMEDVSERFGVLAILAVLGGGILGCAAVSLMMHNALQAFCVKSDSMPNKYVLLSREAASTLVSTGVSVLRGQ